MTGNKSNKVVTVFYNFCYCLCQVKTSTYNTGNKSNKKFTHTPLYAFDFSGG